MGFNIDFSGLDAALDGLGVSPARPTLLPEAIKFPRSSLLKRSMLVTLQHWKEVQLSEVDCGWRNLLFHHGHQVVLQELDERGAREQKESEPLTFHLVECDQLTDWRVMREPSEWYQVRGWVEHGFNSGNRQRIRPCESCLYRLNYQGFALTEDRDVQLKIINQFDLFEFFAFDSSYPCVDHYTYDWSRISFRARDQVGWICESCGVGLAEHRYLLHVHHIDGYKTNNSPVNLRVLCLACHAQQPGHEHLVGSSEDRQLIQCMQRERGPYKLPEPGTGSRQAWQAAFEDADPAAHSLLHILQHQGFSVPEIGVDIDEPGGEVIFSNAELVWPDRKMIVVLEQDEDSERVKELGWTVQTVQSALDCLLPETRS